MPSPAQHIVGILVVILICVVIPLLLNIGCVALAVRGVKELRSGESRKAWVTLLALVVLLLPTAFVDYLYVSYWQGKLYLS